MAAPSSTTWGSVQGGYGRIGIYTNRADGNDKCGLTVEVWFWSKYSVSDTGNTLYYNNSHEALSGGATASRGSFPIYTNVATGDGWSTSNQVKLASYTTSHTRGTSASTRYLYAKLKDVDRVGGTMSVSKTVSIPALAKYTVTYNMNGGSGGPANQTKYYGKALTLSSTKPTRSGYTFVGWGKSASDTSVDYAAGASYTTNAAITLYAIWKKTITLTYDMNGGTGTIASQSATVYNATTSKTFTLSSTKPIKTGHSFLGWSKTSTATSASYTAGGTCSLSASDTLYAVWKANEYTVSFNANGGTGAPSSQKKTYGKTLTLSSTKPTRTNYTFLGWAASASATTATYSAGGSYTNNSAVTLYAVWKLNYKKPTISQVSVNRWDSDNNKVSDEGQNIRVKFHWKTFNDVTSITITLKSSTGAIEETLPASDKEGDVDKIVGGNELGVETTYTVIISVCDGNGPEYETNKTVTVPGSIFVIDMKAGGKGVSFGKAADLEGYADFAFKTRHRDTMVLDNNVSISSRTRDDSAIIHMININDNDNTVVGYGGYSKGIGATNIYGKAINLTSTDGIKVEGRKVATNKVLWSGAYYMNSNQTCTLSEAITAQANGIILVWSEYTDDAVVNANFNCLFIPRRFVHSHESKGVVMICSSATLNYVAAKYVYISDTSIAGYTNNSADAAQATCGVTTSPKRFVLRYVIGV